MHTLVSLYPCSDDVCVLIGHKLCLLEVLGSAYVPCGISYVYSARRQNKEIEEIDRGQRTAII